MKHQLQILSIIPYKIYPAKLGGEKGIAVFNDYLSKQAELVAVTVRENDPELAPYRLYNIMSNSRSRYANVQLYSAVRRLIKKHRCTHLLIEHPYFGWLAWMIKRTTQIRWLVHSHNIEYLRSRSIGRTWWKGLYWYEKWVYKNADLVFFISDDDRQHAIQKLGISEAKALTVTYGVDQVSLPENISTARNEIRTRHAIPDDAHLMLFNGALYHSTNYDALKIILEKINPVLESVTGFSYRIIVCGKGLPEQFNRLEDYRQHNVVYAGFVDDIETYFKAAEVFLNPILAGGGVKTKAIEAIALNCTVVSSELGAMGIRSDVCGEKLKVIEGEDWNSFALAAINACKSTSDTPSEFYEYYSWPNIIARVITALKNDPA
jgi:glycosyltransferase involved in cell wall biosynthesis